MIGRRLWILVGALLVAQAFYVSYENKTDDWFSANERWTIGLPWSPWYERTWWSNEGKVAGILAFDLSRCHPGCFGLAQ